MDHAWDHRLVGRLQFDSEALVVHLNDARTVTGTDEFKLIGNIDTKHLIELADELRVALISNGLRGRRRKLASDQWILVIENSKLISGLIL